MVLGISPLPITHAEEPPSIKVDTPPKISATEQIKEKYALKSEPLKEIIPVSEVANIKPATPAPSQSGDNETIAWNFLISQGYTRNQTAGIMGNLQQEHGFKTSDVPGGLGIAQWMGGRRANLMARPNYLDINVQLQFLVEELNGGESRAKAAIVATDSLESATMAFSSLFERCGVCRNEQRIQYAYQILGRH